MPRSPHSSPAAYRRRNLSRDRRRDPDDQSETEDFSYHDEQDDPDFTSVRGSANRNKYEASPQHKKSPQYRDTGYNTRSSSKSPQDGNKQKMSPPSHKSPSSLNRSPQSVDRSLPFSDRSPGSSDRSPGSSDRSSLYPDLSDSSNEGKLYPTLGEQGVRRQAESPRMDVNAGRISLKQNINKQQREHSSSNAEGLSYVTVCVIIILIVLGFVYVFVTVKSDVRDSGTENTDSLDEAYLREMMVKNFTKEMSVLQESYRRQDGKLWRVLRSATKRVLSDPSPLQPAVILLVSDQTGGQTLSCLAKLFTRLVGKVTDTSSFNVDISSLGNMESNDAKYKLDKELRAGLSRGSESVWLKDLQALDGTAAMLLHAYCDNENAPYKQATMVITMLINDVNIHEVDKTAWDSLVEQNLENLWLNELGTDNLHALLSRVANNIAVVQPENRDICN